MAQERLDKLLSSTGRWSRKEVKELVRQGRVWVNDRPAARPEDKFDPESAVILVDGELVDCAPFVYIMLHKPEGLLSATEDKRQKTVLDLLPEYLRRRGLFPVGRLDKDTTGLLLITDDGALAHELLSPKKHVDKVYLAQVEGQVNQEDVAALAEGMVLGDGTKCLPAGLEPLEDTVLKKVAKVVCPVIFLFGIYIILNGHLSPGGGPDIKAAFYGPIVAG